MFSNILVPLDGSELGDKALPKAQNLAQAFGSAIHLIQVVSRDPELRVIHSGGGESIQALEIERDSVRHLIETRITRGKEYLEASAVQLQNAGIKTTTVMLEGSAVENIVEYAKDQGIDLIVMSSQGYGGFKRLILGSVTDRVIRSGVAQVLVLPSS